MEKQISAVDVIINEFELIKDLDASVQVMILRGKCEEAKELFKQQIEEAFDYGSVVGRLNKKMKFSHAVIVEKQTFENYFNETFKQ